MENLTKTNIEALDRYFNSLSNFGYVGYGYVDMLLVMIALDEFLDKCWEYITEEDYRVISKVANCIYGSTCLVDFPSYETYDTLFHPTHTFFMPRESETGILRISEEGGLRCERRSPNRGTTIA